jgi:hypothetical protein
MASTTRCVRHEVWIMRLFYSPGACSLAPHIILSELEQVFDLERVDFTTKKTETGRDFNSVNSKGCVPALELANGEILEIVQIDELRCVNTSLSADVDRFLVALVPQVGSAIGETHGLPK